MQLTTFSFQEQLRKYFKEQKKIWDFFSSLKVKEEEYTHFKTEILKNTYRLSREHHANYHTILDQIKEKFQLNITIFLYQEQNNAQANASVFFINNEAHIILAGSVLEKLTLDELRVVLAHELGHVLLYTFENGDFQTTERIMNAITDDMRSPTTYFETARIYDLYTELFCDFASFYACEQRDLVINTLVKMHTGLEKVFAEEYLEQVNEIFSKEIIRSESVSHPEIYYRVKSLALLSANYEEGKIAIEPYISGQAPITECNLFEQKKWQELSYKWIQVILSPKFMQSSLTTNHAKTFFPNFQHNSFQLDELDELAAILEKNITANKEYLAYILLDFTLVDIEIYEYALVWCLQLSERFYLKSTFEKILKKELVLSDLTFKDLVKKSLKLYENLPDNQLLDLEKMNTFSSKNLAK